MKSVLALVVVAALGMGAIAFAGPPRSTPADEGAACIQAGIGTLKELGLLVDAAQQEIDYSTLSDTEDGPIFAALPEGSFLSLGQVVKLHKTNPELFAWC